MENPYVGGSIPPRATKNISHAMPTHASGHFALVDSQSSAPAHLRFKFIPQHFVATSTLSHAPLGRCSVGIRANTGESGCM